MNRRTFTAALRLMTSAYDEGLQQQITKLGIATSPVFDRMAAKGRVRVLEHCHTLGAAVSGRPLLRYRDDSLAASRSDV